MTTLFVIGSCEQVPKWGPQGQKFDANNLVHPFRTDDSEVENANNLF